MKITQNCQPHSKPHVLEGCHLTAAIAAITVLLMRTLIPTVIKKAHALCCATAYHVQCELVLETQFQLYWPLVRASHYLGSQRHLLWHYD